jgi:predicted nucleotidyltransferase
MIKTESSSIPEYFQADVSRAVRILKEGGCTEIFLFGSRASGKARDGSDIDLAIRGCPPGHFFHLLGQLLLELDHSVDLVDLDTEDAFAQHLQKEGVLVRVG